MDEDIMIAENQGTTLILRVKIPQIDLANVGMVRKEYSKLEAGTPEFVIIDMQDVNFIDSSGIGWVISVHQQYKKQNTKLCLVSNKSELKEVFALTYIDKLIDIYDDIETAMAKGPA